MRAQVEGVLLAALLKQRGRVQGGELGGVFGNQHVSAPVKGRPAGSLRFPPQGALDRFRPHPAQAEAVSRGHVSGAFGARLCQFPAILSPSSNRCR